MIVRGYKSFTCPGCDRPFEVRTMTFNHPEAPEMLTTTEGWIGVIPSDDDDDGHTSVVLVCSEACCILFLRRGAEAT